MKNKNKFFASENFIRGFKSWITNLLAGLIMSIFVLIISPIIVTLSIFMLIVALIIFVLLFAFYLFLMGFLLKKFWKWK
jgi:uncharacterized membrane protein